MKKENKWEAPPTQVCREVDGPGPDNFNLDLWEHYKSDDIQKNNLLGPFSFDNEKTVGKSHVDLTMTIQRLVFKPNTQDPISNVELGTWKAGYGEKELITTNGKDEQWKEHIALTVFRIVTVVVRTRT